MRRQCIVEARGRLGVADSESQAEVRGGFRSEVWHWVRQNDGRLHFESALGGAGALLIVVRARLH
jgi:hypothetical protein